MVGLQARPSRKFSYIFDKDGVLVKIIGNAGAKNCARNSCLGYIGYSKGTVRIEVVLAPKFPRPFLTLQKTCTGSEKMAKSSES